MKKDTFSFRSLTPELILILDVIFGRAEPSLKIDRKLWNYVLPIAKSVEANGWWITQHPGAYVLSELTRKAISIERAAYLCSMREQSIVNLVSEVYMPSPETLTRLEECCGISKKKVREVMAARRQEWQLRKRVEEYLERRERAS